MKVRLIEPIGKKFMCLFETPSENEEKPLSRVVFEPLLSMETTIDNIHTDWDKLQQQYGKRIGWGLDIIYNTESGKPEPGDMFFVEYDPQYSTWNNSDGKDLHCILPNGNEFNIDSRAANCTMKEEKTHRCWVRTGTPPNITAGKNGNTCSAGAGSILSGDWHGFLRNGELIKA
jgi:hypothetical protein